MLKQRWSSRSCRIWSILVCFYRFWNHCHQQIHSSTSEWSDIPIIISLSLTGSDGLTPFSCLLVGCSCLPIFRNFPPVNGHIESWMKEIVSKELETAMIYIYIGRLVPKIPILLSYFNIKFHTQSDTTKENRAPLSIICKASATGDWVRHCFWVR